MQPYLTLRSHIDSLRDRFSPVSHTSTFRKTGQITPEEFVAAGDYLVYKFPSWSWSPAASAARQVSYLPREKQYLVTRGVPCSRRLDENFAGGEERVVGDGFGKTGGDGGEEGEGWLSTGGDATEERGAKVGDVRALGERGEVEREEEMEDEEEEIPDIDDEDEDEEAIIRETGRGKGPLRTYTLYITYTTYYRTPRLYLSGYHASSNTPLAPSEMLEDIVGDYKDKTVTLEDFPFFDNPVKTASVHPCKHASVMKVLLDRADAALKLRKERLREKAERGEKIGGSPAKEARGLEGLVDDVQGMRISDSGRKDKEKEAGKGKSGSEGGDEWEVLGQAETEEEEPAIRVDQYVVVFLKFMASVTPGIEHDFTMGV